MTEQIPFLLENEYWTFFVRFPGAMDCSALIFIFFLCIIGVSLLLRVIL